MKELRDWRELRLAGLALACALVPLAADAAAASPAGRSNPLPPPANETAVLRQLLSEALGAGANAPIIAFIARYPDEALTETARQALRARPIPDPAPAPGPDGEIFMAFDLARLARGPALADFAARYPAHPLAAEALRPVWQR